MLSTNDVDRSAPRGVQRPPAVQPGSALPAFTGQVLAMVTDGRGRLSYVNDRLLALGGWSWEDVHGRPWYEVLAPDGGRGLGPAFGPDGASPIVPAYAEVPIRTADGGCRLVAWASNVTTDAQGVITAVSSIGVDISRLAEERDRLSAELHYAADHDELTGLANRVGFRAALGAALDAEPGATVAVVVVNIDGFRDVTQVLDHEAADDLLREMAERLRGDDGVVAARLAADEFALFRRVARHADAATLASDLVARLTRPYHLQGEFHISVSAGVAVSPADGTAAAPLIRNAGLAMHHAKCHGAEHWSLYRSSIGETARERLLLEQQLRGAVHRGEIAVHYQPQVDARTHRIVGVEALARWVHPTLGSVPPSRFVPVAERTGQIVPLGLYMLRSALEQGARWRAAGFPAITIAVNVSARQLASPTLADEVRHALAATRTPPQLLELEVTESAVMEDVESAAHTLSELAAMGVHISLDDFGTGYSCLSYLQHLSVGTIKIDRSFLQASRVVKDANALVRALIALGRSLELRIVAEGVETTEHLARLEREGGSDVYQGFLFSRPVPADGVARMLTDGGAL